MPRHLWIFDTCVVSVRAVYVRRQAPARTVPSGIISPRTLLASREACRPEWNRSEVTPEAVLAEDTGRWAFGGGRRALSRRAPRGGTETTSPRRLAQSRSFTRRNRRAPTRDRRRSFAPQVKHFARSVLDLFIWLRHDTESNFENEDSLSTAHYVNQRLGGGVQSDCNRTSVSASGVRWRVASGSRDTRGPSHMCTSSRASQRSFQPPHT